MQSNNKGVANREEPLSHGVVIVLGMGEVGQPLFQILSRTFDCVAVDIKPVDINQPCEVLHICYPFQVRDFVGITAAYIKKYDPRLTVIHSTLAPGTTRKIHETLPGRAIVYSPVRGKHARMEADMLRYKKFVAGFDPQSVEAAQTHFRQAGLADRYLSHSRHCRTEQTSGNHLLWCLNRMGAGSGTAGGAVRWYV